MRFLSWLQRPSAPRPPRFAHRFQPRLEAMEDRTVPSTLTVTNTNDGGPGSLRAFIKAAHRGDTITFAPALAGQTITLTGGELTIAKNDNLTIAGPAAGPVTISGGRQSRVFEVTAKGQLTLTGLVITGGYARGASTVAGQSGGGIDNHGTVTVSNCTITGNRSFDGGDSFGGGIYNAAGAALTVNNSTFTNNSAFRAGGGIYNDAGAGLTVSHSSFSVNSGYDGGAIYNLGTASIGTSDLFNNLAKGSGPSQGDGGAVYNGSGGTLTLTACTLSGNSASDGGAVANAAGGSMTVRDCTIAGNTAADHGGGIYNAGTLSIDHTAFSLNGPDNIFGPYTDGGGNTFS